MQRDISMTSDCADDVSSILFSERCKWTVADVARDQDVDIATVCSCLRHDSMQITNVASQNNHPYSLSECADRDDCTTETRVLADSIARLASTNNHSVHDTNVRNRNRQHDFHSPTTRRPCSRFRRGSSRLSPTRLGVDARPVERHRNLDQHRRY